MRTTIDASGRLVIPRQIRREAGLEPGMELEIYCRDGRIEIEPATLPVRLVQEGPFLVAVPEVDVPPLTRDIVNQTRKEIHGDRAASMSGRAELPA